MSILVKKASKFAVSKETTFGTDPVTGYSVLDIIDVNPKRSLERLDRDIIRYTFDKASSLSGAETLAYDIAVELKGSGTIGTAPESDALWECAFGRKRTVSGTVTVSSAGTTPFKTLTVNADPTSIFKAGDLVFLTKTAFKEVRQIASVSTSPNTIVLTQGFSADPSGCTVKGGVQYQLKLTTDSALTELPSFYGHFLRGGTILEKLAGCKVGGLRIDWASGQIVKPSFSIQGKVIDSIAAGSLSGTAADAAQLPHVARYMTVLIDGVVYPLSGCNIALDNTLYRQTAITTAGTQNLIRTSRAVSGSMQLLYDSTYTVFETAWFNNTSADLLLASSRGDTLLTEGNIFAVCLPAIRYSDVPKSDDSGLYRMDITFEAGFVTGEDTIYAAWL